MQVEVRHVTFIVRVVVICAIFEIRGVVQVAWRRWGALRSPLPSSLSFRGLVSTASRVDGMSGGGVRMFMRVRVMMGGVLPDVFV